MIRKKRCKTGPILFIHSIVNYCKFKNIFKPLMNQTSLPINHKCNDLVIYPEKFFYPYSYIYEINKMFDKNTSVDISLIIDSYSVHFYGWLTNEKKVGVNDHNLYEYLAAQNCPFNMSMLK